MLDLRPLEAVDTGRNGRMRGENRGGAPRSKCFFPGHRLLTRGVHEFADALDAEEAGVSLVGVEHFRRRQAGQPLEGSQCLHPAHAQQQFLLETLVPAAAIQAVGDVARRFIIARDVGIQQQQWDASDVGPPDVGQQFTAVGKRQHYRCSGSVFFTQECEGESVRVKDGIGLLLPGVAGEGLLEVAGLVEEPDSDQRDTQIGCRLEVVAGQDAEAAGVLGEHSADSVLGREVCDGPGSVLTE